MDLNWKKFSDQKVFETIFFSDDIAFNNSGKSGKNWRTDESTDYLHIKATVSKVGVLEYPERGYNTIIGKDVLKRDGKTLEDKPFVSVESHDEDSNTSNTNGNGKGWVKNGSVHFDGTHLHCEVVVTCQKIIDQILYGDEFGKKLKALSCRYGAVIEPENGNKGGIDYQYRVTKLIYNHLCIVDRGRAGPSAVIHADKEIMADEDKKITVAIKLPAVTHNSLNLGEQTVQIFSDRVGEETLIQERFQKMSDAIFSQNKEIEDLKKNNVALKTEVGTVKEKGTQLFQQMSDMVPVSKMTEMVGELVELWKTCKQIQIKVSDEYKNNPVEIKCAVCAKMAPKSYQKFQDTYKALLDQKQVNGEMMASLNSMYDSVTENLQFTQDLGYMSKALGLDDLGEQNNGSIALSDQQNNGGVFKPILQGQQEQAISNPVDDYNNLIELGGE